jgi:hypothetical protein
MALCSVLGIQSVQVGGLSARIGRSEEPAGFMGVLGCTGECCLRCMLSFVGASAIVATCGGHKQGT